MCIARLTNNELERVWKKAVVAYFEIGGTEKTSRILSQNRRCPGRYSNRARPDYKLEWLPHELTCPMAGFCE
jgi:hypothetical protein